MSSTNRLVNRAVLLLAGLILLGAGAVAVLASVPATADSTAEAVTTAREQLQRLVDDVGSTTAHAIGLVVAIVVMLAAVLTVANRGGGKVGAVVDGDPGLLAGRVELSRAFLRDAVAASVGDRSDLAGLDVAVWRDRSRDVLVIDAQPRPGASPRAVVDAVQGAVTDLDTMLGRRLPVLLRVTTGVRRALASPDRVH